jgi:hypothetical protein
MLWQFFIDDLHAYKEAQYHFHNSVFAINGAYVISRKFLIKYYEYSFDYLIIIMN